MLNVTQSTQTLAEAGAYLWDNQGLNRRADPRSFDQSAGQLIAQLIALQHNDSASPLVMARDIENYCSPDLLNSYLDTLHTVGIAIPDATKGSFDALMDISAKARKGVALGWKKEGCPFAGEAEADWHRVFERH